ncbi:conserved hypothetical protein [Cupriavidus taiwanensis]|uniref:hypothetical protein n=1 Tax=Cupriavidus taiwanensis TaxID=164546 RepID=UPI000E12D6DB|nr:hypothetical protein [Cupriavidus taiwanensis]SPA28532.1 conserved hypothetical protein [Cupriavidus taiwanensis]
MTRQIQKPEPLDRDKWYTRDERRAYSEQLAAYEASLRKPEKPAPIKETPEAQTVRELSDSEYDDLKRHQWEQQRAREKEREAEREARKAAEAEYLASMPAVADILVHNPYDLVLKVAHWAQKNYTLPEDGVKYFGPVMYHVQMAAPASATNRKTK